ncbi:MAG: RIP metalloprotease RseP [Thermodesulfobacteriota bacterium]
MITILSFVLVLGVLIFIHELGHFAVAKLVGVGVEKFSLGFGPKILGFTRGETEYRVSILPLGGYVKMTGESVDDEVSEEDRKKSFTHKPISRRAAIVVAGPIMNLVLAFLLLPIIYMIGVSVPAYLDSPARLGYVTVGEAASKAGLEKGDTVEFVNGDKIKKWEDLITITALSPDRVLDIKYSRGGVSFETQLTPEASKSGAGIGGFFPPMAPRVATVSKGYPAEEAGIEDGDLILSIDGAKITHWAELEGMVSKSEKPLAIVVDREGATHEFEITPQYNEEREIYLIGVSRAEEMIQKRFGLFKAVAQGFRSALEMTVKLFEIIKGLIVGQYSLKTLGGPIMIAQVAGQAAESGIVELIGLMAFLSLQLGIINLFPIPVLDGGHLVFFGIEFIRGRPLSDKVISVTQQVGIALLITLMVLVTYNDIFRILG